MVKDETMLKRIFLSISLSLLFVPSFAQNTGDLVFFTPEGGSFWVILNGVRQNEQPQTNVRIEGVRGDFYRLKVIFADDEFEAIDKNIMGKRGKVVTYRIRQTGDNDDGSPRYKVQYKTEAPLIRNKVDKDQNVIRHRRAEVEGQQVTITQQTTTHQHHHSSHGHDVHQGDYGMGAHMDGGAHHHSDGSHSTTTTTTTTTTTNVSGTSNTNQDPMPGYKGPTGCKYPMADDQFKDAKRSIEEKSFSDSKLKTAKQVARSNCLKAAQVKSITEVFGFEDTRLSFAKFAYEHTYDAGNYYKVNDAFDFESSIEELNKYIDN